MADEFIIQLSFSANGQANKKANSMKPYLKDSFFIDGYFLSFQSTKEFGRHYD